MAQAWEQGYVQTTVEDHIASIEFFHPLSNSLPSNLLRQLAEQIEAAGEDAHVLAVVLRSAGDRAFCAGASFDELISIQNLTEGKEFFSGFARVINAMRRCPKFIVARVQGKAVGGAVGLAASAEYALATEHAAVKLSELAVGIGPFVVGPAVERKIGLSGMSDLAIHATAWRDASWAAQRGLYNELYADAAALDQGLQALLQKLKTFNPQAMAEMKKIFWQGTEHWDELLSERAAISGELVLSEFTKNAIESFKKK